MKISIFFFAFLVAGTVHMEFALAESPTPPKSFQFKYCSSEIQNFCAEKKGTPDLGSCLMKHNSDLSVTCKEDIERYLDLRRQATSRGGGALGAFGGLNAFGAPIPLISYDYRYSPGINSPIFSESKENISAPVYRSGTDILSLSLAGSDLHTGSPVVLSSGLVVPTDLYRVELGSQFFRQLPEDNYWSLRASVGYTGDQPFINPSEETYSINYNYGLPSASKSGFFILSIFFSNNSPLGNYIPIPGLAYLYRTENFTGLFGFPITALQWTPSYPWTFSFALFGPTIQTETAYGQLDGAQLFAGYYWTRQSYILGQFTDSKERLTLQEMRVSMGVRHVFLGSLFGEIQFGRSFNRTMFAGDSLFDDSYGVTNISDDWYSAASLRLKF